MLIVKWSNSSIWPIDKTISGTTTPESSNEGVFHNPQISCSKASPLDAIFCHTWDMNSILPIAGTLTGTTTSGLSRPGNNIKASGFEPHRQFVKGYN